MLEDTKVCQWGAFDVANYGDRLFPLIAREQLTARLPGLALTCYAPVGHANLPPGSPPLFPLVPGGGPLNQQRREYFARHFDAIIIGVEISCGSTRQSPVTTARSTRGPCVHMTRSLTLSGKRTASSPTSCGTRRG